MLPKAFGIRNGSSISIPAKDKIDPICIMEGGDGFRSAAKYCFEDDNKWSDHIREAHPHLLTSHGLSQEEYNHTGYPDTSTSSLLLAIFDFHLTKATAQTTSFIIDIEQYNTMTKQC